MIQIFGSYRIFIKGIFMYKRHNLVICHIRIYPYDISPIGHNRFQIPIAQIKDTFYYFFFHILHFTVFCSFNYHRLDFFFCNFRLGQRNTQHAKY